MFRQERNVLFVPVGRSDALAAAILRLLEDQQLRQDMGERNRAAVKAFTPDVVIPRYATLLNDSVSRQRGAK